MAFLLFPHQLFEEVKNLDYKFYLIEEPRFFTDFKFHKLKLVYHRSTMKKFANDNNIQYIEYKDANHFYKTLKTVTIFYPGDHDLEKKMKKIFGKNLNIIENPNFLVQPTEIQDIFKDRYSHEQFYKYQRKKLDILMKDGKPIGKWSFDKENRKRLPKNIDIPEIKMVKKNKYIKEAITYIEKHFPKNYGSIEFFYPIDHDSSIKWLDDFLEQRLSKFGPYEDAVNKDPFLFHSVLSPMMNIGLLTDKIVVKRSYEYYLSHKIPIESFEGFIRQVIGWRNYVYSIYLLEGEKMRESNQLKHTFKLSKSFWEGTTGVLPIDDLIHKIVKYGYVHHIERLMFLGNFMLISRIDPKEVYRIFMEWTIDSYDWVMVPNVFGMSQFSTDIMMKRPYFSSSNYIIKMSHYKKDGKWDKIWDALYYSFIDKHELLLKRIYSTSQLVNYWNRKKKDEKDDIRKDAISFIKNL